jgi:hypothetical protein
VVDGSFDLTGVELRCPVEFDTCRFDSDDPIGLSMATAPSLVLRNCKLPGVSARSITVNKGLDLSGSTISGVLDLSQADISGGLTCEDTSIEGVNKENISFAGRGLKVAGGARLSDLTCKGAVLLDDADVTGPLFLRGARVKGTAKGSAHALSAAGLTVSSGAYLDNGFHADGPVNLLDAQITGQLSLRAATIESGQSLSFAGDRMSVTGGVWLDKTPEWFWIERAPTFTASGPVRMSGAIVGGQLSLAGAIINHSAAAGTAVSADQIKIATGATFINAKITGTLLLSGADITGWLNLDRAEINGNGTGSGGIAISAPGITVTGGISLSYLVATGAVSLANAAVGADVRFDNAQVKEISSGWNRKVADALRAGAEIVTPKDAVTPGGIVLTGAAIGGTLRFVKATITSVDAAGVAVMATSLKVGAGLRLGKPPEEGTPAEGDFTVGGAVVLTDACVTGQLEMRGAQLAGLDSHGRTLVAERLTITGDARFIAFTSAGTMVLAGAQISGELAWLPGHDADWPLDLDGLTTDRLDDDGHWPRAGELKLNGFKYSAFSGDRDTTLLERLDWIRGQYRAGQETRGIPVPWQRRAKPATEATLFSSQPYQQLASVYQDSGQDDEARQVHIAANADRRRWGALKPGAWWANKLFDVTIKFGYKSWRAVVGLLAVYAIAVIAFSFAESQPNLIIPTGSATGASPAPTASQCGKTYPCFYPAGFAIDIVVPIVNVHQADEWAVNGSTPWGWVWVGGTWVATGLGWALATLFVAGYTGLVRSD